MDKQEYKILSEEIMSLVASERFVEAVKIADKIDWRKVRSFSTLEKISELYRINRRFEEAMDIMLMAYDRNPNSRTIVYALCELAIDLDDLVAALQYLALYKRMAPNDKGALILQYKILEMQNAKTEEKIELLEELNRKDYTEEWAYQLAYLYHRIGLATKCVETCDQMITWFGYGPFVIKAIELKMLHAPLTEKQQEIYDRRNDISDQIEAYESDDYTIERAESSVAAEMGKEDFHVKTIDMGKFNTLNLQKALAESMRELMGDDMGEDAEEDALVSTGELEERMDGTQVFDVKEHRRQKKEQIYEDPYPEDGEYYPEEELAEGEEYYPEESEYPEEEMYPEEEPYPEDDAEPQTENVKQAPVSKKPQDEEVFFEDKTDDIVIDVPPAGTVMPGSIPAAPQKSKEDELANAKPLMIIEEHQKVERKQSNSVFDNVLSQGTDGQISLVVPETTIVEKQITGQMNLQDMLQDWENIKKRKEEERKEKTSKDIMSETGKIFADFEAGGRTGPLAKIEGESKLFNSQFIETEIELRNAEEMPEPEPTAEEKMRYTQGSIWDEVDAAVEADKFMAENEESEAAAEEETAEEVIEEALPEEEELPEGELSMEETAEEESLEEAVPEGYEDVGYVESEEPAEQYETEEALPEEAYAQEEYPAEEYAYAEGDMPEEAYQEELPEQAEAVSEQILDTSQINNIGDALEAQADKVGADTAEEDNDNYTANEDDHYLTVEEQELFSDFMYSKKMRHQILDAIDQISLAPYVGNVIITGDSGMGVIELAKTMIKEIQMIDSNFSASRVAKISGEKMNKKDLVAMFEQLSNGALIIEKAGAMSKDTLENMTRILEGNQEGIIIIMTDRKKEMEKLIEKYDLITGYFNARIDVKPMNDNALVDYAKKYAYTREYKIDEERAVLALHRRINELQIGEHNVTTREIEDIIDEAIERSRRLRFSTYVDILVGKRYDYEDMIILKEKDFD